MSLGIQGIKIFKADNSCQKENIDDTHQQRIIFQNKVQQLKDTITIESSSREVL